MQQIEGTVNINRHAIIILGLFLEKERNYTNHFANVKYTRAGARIISQDYFFIFFHSWRFSCISTRFKEQTEYCNKSINYIELLLKRFFGFSNKMQSMENTWAKLYCVLPAPPPKERGRERGTVVCGIRMRLQISLKSTTFVSNCLSHGCILAFFRLTDYTSSTTQSSKENVILLKVFHLLREMK